MLRRFMIEIDDTSSDAEKEIEELVYRFGAEEDLPESDMRLIDGYALARKIFSHSYSVPVLENENKVLSEVLQMVHNAPTVKITETEVQAVLNKRCMTAVTNEYLIALHQALEEKQWAKEHISSRCYMSTNSIKAIKAEYVDYITYKHNNQRLDFFTWLCDYKHFPPEMIKEIISRKC